MAATAHDAPYGGRWLPEFREHDEDQGGLGPRSERV